MTGYFLRRIWNGILVLFGVVTLVFVIFGAKPGDPARMLADQRGSPEALANIRRDLGLDVGVGKRYLLYLNDLSPVALMQHGSPDRSAYLDPARYTVFGTVPLGGDMLFVLKAPYLRYSYQSRRGVAELLADAFPNTALLATLAMLLAIFLGITLGTIAAVKQGSLTDDLILFVSALGMAGPSFFIAVLVAWLGGFVWYEQTTIPGMPIILMVLLPVVVMGLAYIRKRNDPNAPWLKPALVGFFIGCIAWWAGRSVGAPLLAFNFELPGTRLPMTGGPIDVDPFKGEVLRLRNLILPALTLGIRPLAVIVQLTRSSLLAELAKDHIRTARAIGLPEHRVVLRHGLRNALMPVLTAVSGWFASLLAGAVFIEYVFGWHGMGSEVFQALEREDLPVVMGAVLVFASIFVVMNTVVDLLYAVLDPRVRTV